jgi:hypothetical protein
MHSGWLRSEPGRLVPEDGQPAMILFTTSLKRSVCANACLSCQKNTPHPHHVECSDKPLPSQIPLSGSGWLDPGRQRNWPFGPSFQKLAGDYLQAERVEPWGFARWTRAGERRSGLVHPRIAVFLILAWR